MFFYFSVASESLRQCSGHAATHTPQPIYQLAGLHFPRNFTSSYVEAISSDFKDKIKLNLKIKSIARNSGQVTVKMEDGQKHVFDNVVFACNADQALALLEKPTAKEKKLLGA